MNYTLLKSNTKGLEETNIVISPSDNLEKEFFNAMFTGNNIKIEAIPNSDKIVLKKIILGRQAEDKNIDD